LVLDPHLIPDFEILDRIASGGVAEVFRARRESDGLEVALKVMSLNESDPEFHAVERFHREGELLERLDHPSLPRFYGHGVTYGGLGWIAQELVKGEPLSAFALRHATVLIPIFIQVAEGLQAVAQEGIVHRDISPDNILVEVRHGRGHARLIDFGIAKDILAGEGGLTRHGAFLGKLAYASPEQLVGLPKGQTIDFRSDVYSFGMTMYELLAGRRAVEGESLPELVDGHLKGRYPPLALDPDRGGPAPRLVGLVTRMISKSRDDRPSSWEEIVADLWRSREEVAPLAETLARKRVDRTGTFEQMAVRTVVRNEPLIPALPAETSRALSREVLFGRVVLGVGVVAFAGSALFAISYVRSSRRSLAPDPSLAPTPRPTVPETPTAAPVRPTATPRKLPTATPLPEATKMAPETGSLTIAFSGGELEEFIDPAGKKWPRRRALPSTVPDLVPGKYVVTIKCPDFTRTYTTLVRAGQETSISGTCIEVK